METFLNLHLRPDLGRPHGEAGGGKDIAIRIQVIQEGGAWTWRPQSLAIAADWNKIFEKCQSVNKILCGSRFDIHLEVPAGGVSRDFTTRYCF